MTNQSCHFSTGVKFTPSTRGRASFLFRLQHKVVHLEYPKMVIQTASAMSTFIPKTHPQKGCL
jgi:hypothetical protein